MKRRRRRRAAALTTTALAASLTALSSCFDLGAIEGGRVPLQRNVTDWRDEVIYQVLVDRFSDGDPSNNTRVNNASLARYQGGDWQGLTDHLDYFRSLGVTTLWISPIVRNVDTDAGIDGYHGYWASDLAELNPHFGDLAALRNFVRRAHAQNIHVVLDIVTNHMGQMFYYDINQNGRPDDNVYGGGMTDQFQNPGGQSSPLQQVSEFDPDFNLYRVVQSFTSLGPAGPAPVIFLNQPEIFRTPPRHDRACDPGIALQEQPECNSWQLPLATVDGYHRRGRIVNYDYDGDGPGVQTLNGDFPGGLKDVDTENPAVRDAMVAAYARWIEVTDIDGLRIDTLKHVPHEFWRDFTGRVRARLASQGKTNFFIFGEAFDGNDALLGSYTQPGEVDSVFYFSQKFRIFHDVFQCEGPTQALSGLLSDRATHFSSTPQPMGAIDAMGNGVPPSQLLVNFMDNHDVPRFLAGIFDADMTVCPQARRPNVTLAQMQAKLRAALVYLLTEDGVPCVYYGTEQNFCGANDPQNRENLWDGGNDCAAREGGGGSSPAGFDTQGGTFRWIARLNRIRAAYEPLRRAPMQVRWTTTRTGTEQDAGMMAYERRLGAQGVLVVLNAHSAGDSETAFGSDAMPVGFAPNTELVDVLAESNPRSFTVGGDGKVRVRLAPWDAVILVPRGEVRPL